MGVYEYNFKFGIVTKGETNLSFAFYFNTILCHMRFFFSFKICSIKNHIVHKNCYFHYF